MFRMGRLKSWSSIFLSLVMMAAPMRTFSANSEEISEERVMQMAEKIGAKYNICPELLTAVAFQESRYNPNAEHEGCVGLMQISPMWHVDRMERLGVYDLREPYGNMLVAADYLLELFKEYEDLGMVLQVYNGDSVAESYWNGETSMSDYANDIMMRSQELERKYENKGE